MSAKLLTSSDRETVNDCYNVIAMMEDEQFVVQSNHREEVLL